MATGQVTKLKQGMEWHSDRIPVPSAQKFCGQACLDAVATPSIGGGFSWAPQEDPQERGRPRERQNPSSFGAALAVERQTSRSSRLLVSCWCQPHLHTHAPGSPAGGSGQEHQGPYPAARLTSHLGEPELWESDAKPEKGSEPGLPGPARISRGNSRGCNGFDQT